MINEQDKQTEVPTEDILVEVKRVDVHAGDLTMNLGQGSKLPWAGTVEIDGVPVSNITEITLHVKMGWQRQQPSPDSAWKRNNESI